MTAQATSTTVELARLDTKHMRIKLIGDSPLICHAWSEKARGMIRKKQTKQATTAREAKDPHQDFLDSLYPLNGGGYGFPAIAFKTAAVDACSHLNGITKVLVRGAVHVVGELVPLDTEPTMREDMVRVGMGVADIRYRGEFSQWSVDLNVSYNAGVLSAEQVVNLFNVAGFAIGVGEMRPGKTGFSYGRFHVATEGES